MLCKKTPLMCKIIKIKIFLCIFFHTIFFHNTRNVEKARFNIIYEYLFYYLFIIVMFFYGFNLLIKLILKYYQITIHAVGIFSWGAIYTIDHESWDAIYVNILRLNYVVKDLMSNVKRAYLSNMKRVILHTMSEYIFF